MSSDNIDRIAFIFFSALTFCAIMNDSYSLFNNLFKNNYVKKKMSNLNKIKKVFIGLLFNNYTNDNEGNIIIEEDSNLNNVSKNPFDDEYDDEYYVDYEIINSNNDKFKADEVKEEEETNEVKEEETNEVKEEETVEIKNNELIINDLSIDDIKIYKDEKHDELLESNNELLESNNELLENIEDYSNNLSYDKITIDKSTINKKEKKTKLKEDKKKKEKIIKEIIIKKTK